MQKFTNLLERLLSTESIIMYERLVYSLQVFSPYLLNLGQICQIDVYTLILQVHERCIRHIKASSKG
jgi:hypothetical protein